MTEYIDLALKVIAFVASIGASAAALAWWLGSRMDKITNQISEVELRTFNHISRLELRLSQRLTRLETKIFNGSGFRVGDESHDD